MSRKIKLLTSILLLGFILTGCDMEETHRNIYLLSADELISYYEFTEEEIGEYDVQEFIDAYMYTDDVFERYNHYEMLKYIRGYFCGDDLEYALITPGERKEYMEYENVKYIVWTDDLLNGGGWPEGLVFDFENNIYYYSNCYSDETAKIFRDSGCEIVKKELSQIKKHKIIEVFEELEVLDYPSEIIMDKQNEYSEICKIAIIYDNKDFVRYVWVYDYNRNDFGEYDLKAIEDIFFSDL